MIRLKQATVRYGNRTVLADADFHLPQAQFAYLTGKSGSGKSTLIKLVSREIAPAGGSVTVAGRPLDDWKKHELRRRMGIVYQSYDLLENKTVGENMAIAALLRGLNREETERETVRLLERVGLSDRIAAYPPFLSGGEQQRVAVARALIGRPQLILADEPTGNLDAGTAHELLELMGELQREERIAMLMVTHDRRLMERFPATIWTIAGGSVRCV